MGDVLIKLDGISKVYPSADVATHALCDVHLTIRAGEYLCIEGPSGCGKTTLLSILGLLERASAGSYRIEGQLASDLGPAESAALRNRKIGFIFQNFNLIGELSIAENIELPLRYRGWGALERSRRVADALERVGLAHRARHMPGQLSGGQQQRVAVARAIAGRPAILLADEPTGNLDTGNGEAVMEILRELHQCGSTICMVTHNPDYARQAERRVWLLDGRIVDERGSEAA